MAANPPVAMRVELHVEDLLSRRVVDAAGETIGRLEEIVATDEADGCFVEEFHVGRAALLERLGITAIGRSLLGPLLPKRSAQLYRVPWRLMDLSDPRHPQVRCRKAELTAE